MTFYVGSISQTCWACGEKAGGLGVYYLYGDYPNGMAHLTCNLRIKKILDRSLRALEPMMGKAAEPGCMVIEALITKSANLFTLCLKSYFCLIFLPLCVFVLNFFYMISANQH